MVTAVSNQPLFARILRDVGRRDNTVAELCIFGQTIQRLFVQVEHRDDAVAWVNKWNDLLDREWAAVRETSAAIMQDFTDALRRSGVDDATIDAALTEVKTRAAG